MAKPQTHANLHGSQDMEEWHHLAQRTLAISAAPPGLLRDDLMRFPSELYDEISVVFTLPLFDIHRDRLWPPNWPHMAQLKDAAGSPWRFCRRKTGASVARASALPPNLCVSGGKLAPLSHVLLPSPFVLPSVWPRKDCGVPGLSPSPFFRGVPVSCLLALLLPAFAAPSRTRCRGPTARLSSLPLPSPPPLAARPPPALPST